MWWRTGYTIDQGFLSIRSGIIHVYTLDIEEIGSIERSYNIGMRLPGWSVANAPALAFKGLMLNFWGGKIKISPKDEEGFIAKIKELNPNVKVSL